jgi:hypothetical protein
MEISWGNEQVERPPERLCPQHWYLIVAVVSLAVVTVIVLIDQITPANIGRGVYDALGVATIGGLCGWLVYSAEKRVERRSEVQHHQLLDQATELKGQVAELGNQVAGLSNQVAELTAVVAELRRAASVAHGVVRATYRPVYGHTYVSGSAVAGDGDTVPAMPSVRLVSAGADGGAAGDRAAGDNLPAGVARLPAPDSLQAARNLARSVLAAERRRAEDRAEDTR